MNLNVIDAKPCLVASCDSEVFFSLEVLVCSLGGLLHADSRESVEQISGSLGQAKTTTL